MAEKALRKLFTYLEYLNPDVLDYLFGEGLITKPEKERIEGEVAQTNKARLILEALEMRDEKKAMRGLIDALKKDAEANEKFLLKIAEGKRFIYTYIYIIYIYTHILIYMYISLWNILMHVIIILLRAETQYR